MLSYRSGPLSPETEQWLSDRQARVNAEPDHATRHQIARRLFASKRGAAFDEIRARLAAISPPGSACFYCERDRYRDIDHIRPIRHFPESCFDWQNHVYACSICNQDAKRDRYAIIDTSGELIAFDRFTSPDSSPAGVHALIDIRQEDPLDFLGLDLETGLFVALGPDDTVRKRGRYTCDLFNLDGDVLSRDRRHARRHFIDYLTRHASARQNGDAAAAERALNEIRELPHPTVLAEIRRQAPRDPRLAVLLEGLPAWPGPL